MINGTAVNSGMSQHPLGLWPFKNIDRIIIMIDNLTWHSYAPLPPKWAVVYILNIDDERYHKVTAYTLRYFHRLYVKTSVWFVIFVTGRY